MVKAAGLGTALEAPLPYVLSLFPLSLGLHAGEQGPTPVFTRQHSAQDKSIQQVKGAAVRKAKANRCIHTYRPPCTSILSYSFILSLPSVTPSHIYPENHTRKPYKLFPCMVFRMDGVSGGTLHTSHCQGPDTSPEQLMD